MKTIGIIGGMVWPSSVAYYTRINTLIAERLGPFHCAKLVLAQVDFDAIKIWIEEDNWESVGQALLSVARKLESAGADFLIIACNTVHKALPAIKNEINIPILHIVDATADNIKSQGFKTVGLLGTSYTMRDDYFLGHLTEKHDIKVIVPTKEQQAAIQKACEREFADGVFSEADKEMFRNVIGELVMQGCEAIVLGCTEFGRYLEASDAAVPLIDTTVEHVKAAVEQALKE